jgi:hypothetical protein
VKNEAVLHEVKKERNIAHTIERRKSSWFFHILRRDCLLKHALEGKLKARIEVMGRRRRRHELLLDDLKEIRGYWKLKAEAIDRTQWKNLWTCRKTDCGMNE